MVIKEIRLIGFILSKSQKGLWNMVWRKEEWLFHVNFSLIFTLFNSFFSKCINHSHFYVQVLFLSSLFVKRIFFRPNEPHYQYSIPVLMRYDLLPSEVKLLESVLVILIYLFFINSIFIMLEMMNSDSNLICMSMSPHIVQTTFYSFIEPRTVRDCKAGNVDSYLSRNWGRVNGVKQNSRVQSAFSEINPSWFEACLCIIENLNRLSNCLPHILITFRAKIFQIL